MKGFADVDPGVVDKGVYPAEVPDRRLHDALRRVRVGDVALDGHYAGVLRSPDRSSSSDHRIPALTVSPRETRADALRGAGDDRDLLVVAHDDLLMLAPAG
jgi:hypothetical protein